MHALPDGEGVLLVEEAPMASRTPRSPAGHRRHDRRRHEDVRELTLNASRRIVTASDQAQPSTVPAIPRGQIRLNLSTVVFE